MKNAENNQAPYSKNIYVTVIQKYSSNGNPGNWNSDPGNRNTRKIKACVLVNLCNGECHINISDAGNRNVIYLGVSI